MQRRYDCTQRAQQHSAGVLGRGLGAGPYHLHQFASHFTEPLAVILLDFLFLCHRCFSFQLLGFGMDRMLSAEGAILVHFKTVRVVLLVLHRVVVSLLALIASQSDLHSHLTAPPY